ncbi:MAG: hypothetical protein Phog2KO_04790 [Phototrophicaceae bacterium]
MIIRPAEKTDISLLAEFWYDQMALYSQKQTIIRLMPDALEQWQSYAQAILEDDTIYFLVIERDNEALGAIIGHIANNDVGLLPQKYGVIDYLILDLHSPHKRKNAVNNLLSALKERFFQQNISHMMVRVPKYSLVEQGFWRGLGASDLDNSFWMDV